MVEQEQNPTPVLEEVHPSAAEIDLVVREALRQVIHPEIGLDVISLGLIRELVIKPEKLHVIMILTTPFCRRHPSGRQLAARRRRGR